MILNCNRAQAPIHTRSADPEPLRYGRLFNPSSRQLVDLIW